MIDLASASISRRSDLEQQPLLQRLLLVAVDGGVIALVAGHAAAVAATTTTSTGHAGEAGGQMGSTATPSVMQSDGDVQGVRPGTAREDARVFDVVRQDLLQGP